MNMVAQMSWGTWLLSMLILGVCVFLIIVVLLQRGRGGGLAGAFGGGGGTSAFGAKTGDVFTWITVVMAAGFIFLACVGNFVFDQSPQALPPTPIPAQTAFPQADGASVPVPISINPDGSISVDGKPIGNGAISVTPVGGPVPIKVTPSGTVIPEDTAWEEKETDTGGTRDFDGGGEERR